MARSVTLGNGNILVGIDPHGLVRDIYFPYVGESNHVSGASGSFVHRIGVFVDGAISWVGDAGWDVVSELDTEKLVGRLRAVHSGIGVALTATDVVHNEKNVFIRSFVVENTHADAREIRLFFSQQFRISESRRGDTGFFDPRVNAIIHYKGHTAFLINALHEGVQFSDYNIGLFGIEGKEGTYYDAVDGVLERNPIEHGSVDSVIGVTCCLQGGAQESVEYWIACGSSVQEVHELNAFVIAETPAALIVSTENYWKAWLVNEQRDLSLLSPKLQNLFNRSLSIIRVHTDNRGGIIASSDTDMLHHGRDTYGYVWPRDAAIIANALDEAGYADVSQRFFSFVSERVEKDGYLLHKYRADGVLGSSWHPWMHHGKPQLPIQEDETALVLFMLWHHHGHSHNIEFIESLYNPFIEKTADFLASFIEPELGLPKNSYDLWEEKFGISTYTASAVYGALLAAADFASMLGKKGPARTYGAVAQRIREGILHHLFDESLGMFVKHIYTSDERERDIDRTVDISSFFGPIYFGVVEPHDPRVKKAFAVIEDRLRIRGGTDGYIRYEGDTYYRMNETGSPNPWIIATLWVAQYHIMSAKKVSDLARAYEILEWTQLHAAQGGVLSEQIHPHTGENLSTSPLVWSHAEFVITSLQYIKKYRELKK